VETLWVDDTLPAGATPLGPWTWEETGLTTPVAFTGHYYHPRSTLHLAPYRAYSADLGRWLNRDPIGEEGGLNIYGYVSNSPLSLTDALGLAPEPVDGMPGWCFDWDELGGRLGPPRLIKCPCPDNEPEGFLEDPEVKNLIDKLWNDSTGLLGSDLYAFGFHEHYAFVTADEVGKLKADGPHKAAVKEGGHQGRHKDNDPKGTLFGIHTHAAGTPPRKNTGDHVVAKGGSRREYVVTKDRIYWITPRGHVGSVTRSK
jgi:RHS repeat-associated protein